MRIWKKENTKREKFITHFPTEISFHGTMALDKDFFV